MISLVSVMDKNVVLGHLLKQLMLSRCFPLEDIYLLPLEILNRKVIIELVYNRRQLKD